MDASLLHGVLVRKNSWSHNEIGRLGKEMPSRVFLNFDYKSANHQHDSKLTRDD